MLSSGLMGLAAYGVLIIAPPQPVLTLMLIIFTGVAAYGGLMLALDRAGVIAVLRLSIELFVPPPMRPRLAAILRRIPLVRRLLPVLFEGAYDLTTEKRRNGEKP
jgi:hypothetical protein